MVPPSDDWLREHGYDPSYIHFHDVAYPPKEPRMDAAPKPKVVAAALGGATATIILWLLTLFRPEIVVPQEVAAALTTILAVVFGYLKTD